MEYPLHEEEFFKLRSFGKLAKVWGYRQGTNGAHARFESTMRELGLRAAEELTDIIFRNIQQVSEQGQTDLRAGDTTSKLMTVTVLSPENFGPNFQALIRTFLEQPRMRDMMTGLARSRLSARSTWGFKVIVYAARAFLLMARGRVRPALRLLDSLHN